MIIVKAYRLDPKNGYFWYVRRMIRHLRKTNQIKYIEIPRPKDLTNKHITKMWINNYPIYIDVRDDMCLHPYYNTDEDCVILKANYSTEAWNNPEKYPLNYPVTDEWQQKLRHKIVPFIYGREFYDPTAWDEIKFFKRFHINKKYKVVSYTGNGINSQQTESRLRLFDLFAKVFNKQAKLVFRKRKHFKDIPIISKLDKWIDKYWDGQQKPITIEKYYELCSEGQYLINVPGIELSQPFRIVDAVVGNLNVISTKIYNDAFKDAPVVELPICGYYGYGDWKKAEEILLNLNKIDWQGLHQKLLDWYNYYLNPQAMWQIQFLKNLKGKI